MSTRLTDAQGIPEHLRSSSLNTMPHMPTGIDVTLAERGSRYGDFKKQAHITQDIKSILHATGGWLVLPLDMREALEMIASKIARILNGDAQYVDNWHDIIGYARLVEKRLGLEKEI